MNIKTAKQLVIADQRQSYDEDEATDSELIKHVVNVVNIDDINGDTELDQAYRMVLRGE